MGKRVLNVLRAKDMNQMSSDELRKVIADTRLEQMKIVGLAKGKHEQPKSPHAIREGKRMIARAMTILVQRGERCK